MGMQAVAARDGDKAVLEHFQAKWIPVYVEKMRPGKESEPRYGSIGTEEALAARRIRILDGRVVGDASLNRSVPSQAFNKKGDRCVVKC